jgi:hypothetical protein
MAPYYTSGIYKDYVRFNLDRVKTPSKLNLFY